jgi:DNA-binding response OmpR family regulator
MVLDVDMPDVGGPEVLREVRQTATAAGLPVIVLTGDTDPETEAWLLELGADDFIRKLLQPTTFSIRVQTVLRRAQG